MFQTRDRTGDPPPERTAAPDRTFGIVCALGVVLLFSGFTLVSRTASADSLRIEDLAALRFGIGALVLAPIFLKHRFAGLSLYQAARLAFLGGLAFALFAYSGLYLAPAAHGAVLLHGTLPLFTFAIVATATRSLGSRRTLPGIVLIALGVLLMASDSLASASRSQLTGDGCLLLASLCWSAYGVTAQRLGIPALQAGAIVAVLSALGFWPVYLVTTGASSLFAADAGELIIQGLYQGLLIGALSIFIYTRAVASLGATQTALFTTAVPCVTTLAAIPLLGEVPNTTVVAGVGAASLGMLLAILGRKP